MTEKTPDNESGEGRREPTDNFPIFSVPASAFRRFNATVLSPDGADVIGEDDRPPTVYRPDRIILPGLPGGSLDAGPLSELERLGKLMQFTPRVIDEARAGDLGDEDQGDSGDADRRPETLGDLAGRLGYLDRLDAVARVVAQPVPDRGRVGPPIDAWQVLQLARSERGVPRSSGRTPMPSAT